MKKAFALLFIVILALSFCSKGKESAPAQPVTWHEKNEPRPAPAAAEPDPLEIVALILSPEAPTVLDDISAAALLADPDAAGVDFRYRWSVNNQEVADLDGEKLDRKFFRKGAWVHCAAQAVSGAEAGHWFKSDTIRVLNSLPALQLAPPGAVRVPGDLSYQATASDPDGDELTYELLAPLEQGIVIDARSGALSWKLTEEIVKALGENIEIRIAVSDGEGEKVTGTISLQFTSTANKTT
jgi:hypothetical protein